MCKVQVINKTQITGYYNWRKTGPKREVEGETIRGIK